MDAADAAHSHDPLVVVRGAPVVDVTFVGDGDGVGQDGDPWRQVGLDAHEVVAHGGRAGQDPVARPVDDRGHRSGERRRVTEDLVDVPDMRARDEPGEHATHHHGLGVGHHQVDRCPTVQPSEPEQGREVAGEEARQAVGNEVPATNGVVTVDQDGRADGREPRSQGAVRRDDDGHDMVSDERPHRLQQHPVRPVVLGRGGDEQDVRPTS